MRVADTLMAMPAILLGLVLVAAFGTSTPSMVVILGIIFAPATARIARSTLLAELRSDYYVAAVSVGASGKRIVARELLPNTLPVLVARASLVLAEVIFVEASLSFVGLGVQPPETSWGTLLQQGYANLYSSYYLSDLPGHRDPRRRARLEHARRQPPEGPRPLALVTATLPETATDVVLEVRDLVVEIPLPRREPIRPVRGVSFDVRAGPRLGIVGESGSGKSLTALSLMRLLPPRARIAAGQVLLRGRDLARTSPSARWRASAAAEISTVYQDPMSSLNPLMTVGRQITEAIPAHERVGRREARERAIDVLGDVGLPQPERRLDDYPHQFSGGMRQRVMIAMAICTNPDVLIADEPTTALDVTTQARIMEMLGRIVEERRMGVILITHDLGLASSFCDDIHVMYAGRIVESGSRRCRAAHAGASVLRGAPRLDLRPRPRRRRSRSPRSPGSRRCRTSSPPAARSTRAAPTPSDAAARTSRNRRSVREQIAECHFPVGGRLRERDGRGRDGAEPVRKASRWSSSRTSAATSGSAGRGRGGSSGRWTTSRSC